LYKTSVDSIKLVNGGLKQGLKRGEIIYIPELKNKLTKVDAVENTTQSSLGVIPVLDTALSIVDSLFIEKKQEYSIGLMLPFYLDENDEMVANMNALDEKSIYPKSKFAIEFYNGFMLALDSISTDSSKFKVYVYDTKGNDTSRTKELLLKPEMAEHDIIVGPLYYNNFKQVVSFAQANKIPVVSPIKQSNKVLLGNEYVFKAIPSKSTTIKQVCTLLVDSFKTENLIAVEYEKSKEKSLVDLCVKSYDNKILTLEDTTIYSSIKTLKINTNVADIVSNLKANKNNVIFVPVSSQTFVTNLFSDLATTLNKKDYEDYKITLIGLEEWAKFENIDLEYYQKLNVHYCSTRFVDTQDSLTNVFIKDYIKKTETYPSNNTLLGFDLAYYFGSSLINTGTLFSSISLKEHYGMSINLSFFKTGIESGFENTSSYMLRFEDYSIKRIQ